MIYDYSYIIIPIIVGITSQVLKLITDGVKGNFDFKNLFISYGGMPSAHTAFAVSVTTLVGLKIGIDSPIFGVALIFTILIMRDAVAFRNILGSQGRLLNKMMRRLPALETADIPKFRERMGHSGLEVTVGAGLGIALTYILNLL